MVKSHRCSQEMILLSAICCCFCYLINPSNAFHALCNVNGNKRVEPFFTRGVSSSSTSMRRETSRLSSTNENNLMPLARGSTVALITPMIPDTLEIDYPALERLLKYHMDAGTGGLCILGTTGEASLLSKNERKKVIQTTVEMCKGKIPIMVGAGTIDPTTVKANILQARDEGADAVLVVTPYYVKPPQRGLIRHFTTAADLGMPTVLYNVPGRTGVDCSPETIFKCCCLSRNIVAVKEATGDVSRVHKIRALLSDVEDGEELKVLLYSGDDATSVDFCLQGGDGCISVTANVAANAMHAAINAALKGDAELANKINAPLELLHDKLFCESNPIPVKWAAERIGLIESGIPRPPLDALDDKFHSVLEEALAAAGLM